MNRKKQLKTIIYHVLLCALGIIMIYPLLWMVCSSFKESKTVFTTAHTLIPENPTLQNYINGWKGFGGVSFSVFFKNSLFVSVIATMGTVLSSSIVAFSLARCKFPGRRIVFSAMLVSMMLPAQVLMIPQYIWYQQLGWVGSYLPMIVPYFFAIQGFFVYLMYSFVQGIPLELDESAKIDGCSYYGIYLRIAMPLMVPSLVTAAIFSFMWRWDDFLGALLYLNKSVQYTVALALKLFVDPGASSDYGAMFAMSTLSLIPAIIIFIFFQKYLVEGISTTGIK